MLNLLLFAFLCCAVASSAAAALPPNEFDAWCAHLSARYRISEDIAPYSAYRVIHHGKTYPSAAARDARRAAFEHNLKFVAFLNSKDPTATFAMTEVSVPPSLRLRSQISHAMDFLLAVCRSNTGGVPVLLPHARSGACCAAGHGQH